MKQADEAAHGSQKLTLHVTAEVESQVRDLPGIDADL